MVKLHILSYFSTKKQVELFETENTTTFQKLLLLS